MTALTTLPAQLTNGATTEEFERTACWMAREYADAMAKIGDLMDAIRGQCQRLKEAFPSEHRDFEVTFSHPYGSRNREDDIKRNMQRTAWGIIVENLGIRNVMSVAKRNEFDAQLEKGELPDITEATIVGMLLGLMGQAQDFAREAAREVFDLLRPWRRDYKTNNPFRVGRRVILQYYVDEGYGRPFHHTYGRSAELTAIDGVFHLMDGKGVMREKSPLITAIDTSETGMGETDYFRFKCFRNRNLHLEFRRLDLVQELNMLAVGERVLGNDFFIWT